MLRSEAWIDANGIRVGETIDLRMTELKVNADALVVAIAEGPEVLPGEGPVVTGRFVTRQASDLVRVTFAGGVERVGTHSHPIWSPLHQDWRGLGEFEPGDLVQARTGLIAVQAVEPLAIRPAVYNIEVAAEHVYEVTELGVLVHNNEPLCQRLLQLVTKVDRTPADDLEIARLRQLIDQMDRLGNRTFWEQAARRGTINPTADTVVLGKWLEDGQSYINVASHYRASYFDTRTWREMSQVLNRDQDLLWRLNREFLDQQLTSGKRIILSHDPSAATSFYRLEVDYLQQLGYRFERSGWVWEAVLP